VVALALALLNCGPPPAEEDPWACGDCNLLLISIDTLRADHLSCYGYSRPTSPQIDRFAAGATLFERASAASFQTTESHMSLFTGLFPTVHGVRNSTDRRSVRLDDGMPSLAEELRRAGFDTAGFHGGGNVSAGYGFDKGFERYEAADDERTMVEWVRRREANAGRWFAFFHTYHVHDPYLPEPPNDTRYVSDEPLPIIGSGTALERELEELHPEGWTKAMARDLYWSHVDAADPRHLQRLIDLYDGEIHEADAMVGRLLAAVEETAPRTMIVILSDHGEAFGEHGRILHGRYLYEELLHVPLILRHPEQRQARRISDPVSLVDVGPTLLEALRVPGLREAQGRSLLPLLRGENRRRAIYAEKIMDEVEGRWLVDASISDGRLKVLRHSGRLELYDLEQDPKELVDLSQKERAQLETKARSLEAIERINRTLRAKLIERPAEQSQPLDEETVKQLQGLGYL
jgi:arylsulfatase A-like enzyme